MEDVKTPADNAENATAVAEPVVDAQAAPAADGQVTGEVQPSQPAAPQAKAENAKSEPKEPHWYREALKEKDRRARDAERRAAELERRIQAQEQQRPLPDFNNPQAVFQTFEERLLEAQQRQSIALSARFARREHGAEVFDQTREWLEQRPDIELWAQAQDDPWEAAIARFKQERLVAEIGDDPNAYREKLRQELLAELQQQPQGVAPGMTAPRLPQSAAGARSAAPKGPIQSKTPFTHQW